MQLQLIAQSDRYYRPRLSGT